jgi:GT2 family glycosyltransferase
LAKRLSVVVPNLDCPLVGRTLEALAAQVSPEDSEILVVGRDASGTVPPSFRREAGAPAESPWRFLETAERLNPAAARNLGVAAARGSLLFFTDADCRPAPGWIERLTAALQTAPVAGGAVTFPHDGNVWALADNIASFHDLLADRPAEADTRRPIGSLNLACTRAAWETVGPFDEALPTSEDHDWVLRARAAGLATAFVPDARVEHAAVRTSRTALEAHATWYGRHFHRFTQLHPGTFAAGPTWQSRGRLRLAAPLKAVTSSLEIYLRHREQLAGCWRALPGVVAFKRAWYRAVLESWPES